MDMHLVENGSAAKKPACSQKLERATSKTKKQPTLLPYAIELLFSRGASPLMRESRINVNNDARFWWRAQLKTAVCSIISTIGPESVTRFFRTLFESDIEKQANRTNESL